MRAARGTQTLDLVITNHSFYQLNYRGIKYAVQDSNPHQQGRNLSFCPVRLTAYKYGRDPCVIMAYMSDI